MSKLTGATFVRSLVCGSAFLILTLSVNLGTVDAQDASDRKARLERLKQLLLKSKSSGPLQQMAIESVFANISNRPRTPTRLGATDLKTLSCSLLPDTDRNSDLRIASDAITALRATDAIFDAKSAMALMTDSSNFVHIVLTQPYQVDFQNTNLTDIAITELWAPLVSWHKFVVTADGAKVAFGRGPNTGFNSLESPRRSGAKPPIGWSKFFERVNNRVMDTPKVRQIECPGVDKYITAPEAEDLAKEAINFAKMCDAEVELTKVMAQIDRDQSYLRIDLAEPHVIKLGEPGLVGSSIDQILLPRGYSTSIAARINGKMRGLRRDFSSSSISAIPYYSISGIHRKLTAIAKREIELTRLPAQDVANLVIKSFTRTYDEIPNPKEGGEHAIRMLQSCGKVAASTEGEAMPRRRRIYELIVDLKEPIQMAGGAREEMVEFNWVRIPMASSSRPALTVYTALIRDGEDTVYHAWSDWKEPAAAWVTDFILTGRYPSRIISTINKREVPEKLPRGTTEEQKKALKQLADAGGLIYATGDRLSLSYSFSSTRSSSINWLEPFDRLYRLSLRGTVGDADLRRLPEMEHLDFLTVYGGHGLSAKGIADLSRIDSIHNLYLSRTQITDDVIKAFGKIGGMTNLTLSRPSFDSVDLGNLKELRDLDFLGLSHAFLNEDRFSAVVTQTPAPILSLYKVPITNVQIASFERSPVTDLRLIDNGISGRQLGRLIKKFPQLSSLGLQGENLLDRSGLRALSSKRTLNELQLYGTNVTDGVLARISLLDLQKVHVVKTQVTKDGIAGLRAMPNLELLRFETDKVDSDTVEILAGFGTLTELNILAKNTDLDSLEPLIKMQGLKKLIVRGTTFEKEDVRALLRKNSTKDRMGTYSGSGGFYVYLNVQE